MRNRFHIVKCLWVIGIVCFGIPAFAQYKFEKPVIFNKEHGLPSNDIRAVAKSRDGFMWVGTSEGLSRFDGIRFRNYTSNPADSLSLIDNRVFCVLPVGEKLWVGTEMGLSILDTRTNIFKNYQFNEGAVLPERKRSHSQGVFILLNDNKGSIWIGTLDNGLYRYKTDQDTFEFFPPEENIRKSFDNGLNRVLSISPSKINDSLVYAGTIKGLLEVNRHTGKVNHYYFPKEDKKYENSLNAFRRIYFHHDGLLYMGNWVTGVHVFDPVHKTLRPLPLAEGEKPELLEPVISRIYPHSREEMWITTIEGLVLYNSRLKKITYHKKNNNREGRFYGVDMIDQSNRAWFNTFRGIYLFDPVVQQFVTWNNDKLSTDNWVFNFYLHEDRKEQRIVVCPRMGGYIYFFDLISHEWSSAPLKAGGKDLEIRGFSKAPDGRFTLSTFEGLYSFDPVTKKTNPFPFQPQTKFQRFGDILWDSQAQLWICTQGEGLFRWNNKTGESVKYTLDPGDSIPAQSISAPLEDSRKNIWFSRNNGFVVYDRKNNRFHHFLHERDSATSLIGIMSFAEDKEARIWMNGGDGWVAWADSRYPEKGVAGKMDMKGDYKLGDVQTLGSDPDGNVWGYTKKKLFRITGPDLKPEQFDFEYGLKEVDFFSFRMLSTGDMVFGGRNEIVTANIKELRRNTELPDPYIAQIQVLQKPYQTELLTTDTSRLRLRHWQNFFSFIFSARAYTMGQGVRFRYRLVGFDENWTDAGERNFVNYTNVPAGDYVFQLQAANNEGMWNDKITELPVFVATAWYNTWLFQVSLLLAVGFGIWKLYRMRLQQVRTRSRVKSEFEKKLANVEMSALLAQMNPHFLFNSLNSIDSYIIRNESKKASEYLNSFARLMRLILNNSRSNYISLKDELETLELYLQMESLRFKDRFVYEIQVDDSIDIASVNIPPMLIQPYVENAIWHGLMHKEPCNEERKVTIKIMQKDNYIICVVEDNGIGREKATALNIKRGSRSRKSMGMRITEDRIEIINKLYNTDTRVFVEDLKDENGEPEGTRVELRIPS